MKNVQKGFAGVIVVILIAITVLGGTYFYFSSKTKTGPTNKEIEDTATTSISVSTNTPNSKKIDSPNTITKGEYTFEDSSGTQFVLQIMDNNKAHISVTGTQMYRKFNLVYTIKDNKSNFYFDSFDNSDINANGLEIANKIFNKGDPVFSLNEVSDSNYKVTWNKSDLWLNNVGADKDNSFFKKN